MFLLVPFFSCKQKLSFEPENSVFNTKYLNNSESDEPDVICANRWYADRLFDPDDSFGWMPCDEEPEEYIDGDECAYLWAAYNPFWDEDLLFQACDESIPTSLPSISNLTKINGANPEMKWDFMWAHYYVIERKIGTTGSWSVVNTITLPLEPMTSTPDTTYRDGSISFRTFEDIVYYRVYGKVWSELSSTAPMIYWDCRLSK